MADAKIHTIPLTVQGATQNLPTALTAYGRDCSGHGMYAYLALPNRRKALLVHEVAAENGGKQFFLWKAKVRDVPPLDAAMDRGKGVSGKAAQAAIDSFQKATKSAAKFGSGVLAQTFLKGSWSGHIECAPSGPRVVLRRTIAQYTTMVLYSKPDRGWEYAIIIRDLAKTHWFTKSGKRSPGSPAPPKEKTLSDSGFGTMQKALNAAVAALFRVVEQSCVVKETHRPAALGSAEKAAANAKLRQKGKAPTAPLSAKEAKAVKKARKAVKTTAGKAAKRVKRVVKKEDAAAAKARKAAARVKAKARKAAQKAAQKAAKAAKPKAPRKVKKAGAKIRAKASKAQQKLKGRFVILTATKRAALVIDVGPNAKGDWDPRHGGAKLTVLIPTSKGVSKVEVNEFRPAKGRKQPKAAVSIKGAKAAFVKAWKAIAFDGKKLSQAGAKAQVAAAAEFPTLAAHGVKVMPRVKKAAENVPKPKKVKKPKARKVSTKPKAPKKPRAAKKPKAPKAAKSKAERKPRAPKAAAAKKASEVEDIDELLAAYSGAGAKGAYSGMLG